MFDSLQPHGLQPTRFLCPWDSPGKNTGVGCHFLLQGIFPTQGSNQVSCIGRWILYNGASWKARKFACLCVCVCVCVLVAQSCPTLCYSMDYSLPDSSVHGILYARILDRVDFRFSRRSSQSRGQTWVSFIAAIFFTI